MLLVEDVEAQTSSRWWCGEDVRREVLAQVSSSSLDHGSKLRGPSPIGSFVVRLKYNPLSLPVGGRGSRVVKILSHGWPCHEFETSTTKDPPCRGAVHVKPVKNSNVFPLV
ncbi:hypothetical protein TNCV_4521691 [Trichonephila clavipes]|nr:hypothetical protein TNCV_4521691 [Trichonephila clavipes]